MKATSLGQATWPSARAGWTAVAVLNIAYLVSFIDRSILGLLVEPIKADLGIDDTQFALLQGAAFGLFYTMLGLPFGWAMDRWPRTRLIGLGCACWSAMTASCGLATGFSSLFAARMGVGLGEAALSPGAASLLADLFPNERRSLAMAVYASGASIGIGLSMIAGGGLILWLQHTPMLDGLDLFAGLALWQRLLMLIGLAGLPVAAAIACLPEPARQESGAERSTPARIAPLIRREGPVLGALFAAIALFGLVSYAILGWAPACFIRVHHWTAAETGLRFGLVLLLFAPAGALVGGWLPRVLSRRTSQPDLATILIGLLLAMPFGVAAPLVRDATLSLALYAPVAASFAIPTGPAAAFVQNRTPNRLRGRVMAIYYLAIGLIGILLGPLGVALATEHLWHASEDVGKALALTTGLSGGAAISCLLAALRFAGR